MPSGGAGAVEGVVTAWLKPDEVEDLVGVLGVVRHVGLAPAPAPSRARPKVVWRDRAACAGMPAALFFPERLDTVTGRLARSVCAGCAVRTECLEAALAEEAGHGLPHGIRGGLTAAQRQARARARAINVS
jgi:WhiB family redox-sensing transcriptional regulator